jgi:hypothetical protein
MRVAKNRDKIEKQNRKNVADLTLSEAVAVLAIPPDRHVKLHAEALKPAAALHFGLK